MPEDTRVNPTEGPSAAASRQHAGWRELLARRHLPQLLVLCLAIWLHAANSMLTATTLPGAVEDIGGLRLISWAFALYLMGSIVAATSFGMMWGYIIKRVIAHAAPEDRDRAGSLLPSAQQTGFALGAALAGIITNGLGFEQMTRAEEFRTAAFWLFAGFVPPALLGCLIAWRFGHRIRTCTAS